MCPALRGLDVVWQARGHARGARPRRPEDAGARSELVAVRRHQGCRDPGPVRRAAGLLLPTARTPARPSRGPGARPGAGSPAAPTARPTPRLAVRSAPGRLTTDGGSGPDG